MLVYEYMLIHIVTHKCAHFEGTNTKVGMLHRSLALPIFVAQEAVPATFPASFFVTCNRKFDQK